MCRDEEDAQPVKLSERFARVLVGFDRLRERMGGWRTTPITHLTQPGRTGCERMVVCRDYREGESIAFVPGPLVSCPGCRARMPLV